MARCKVIFVILEAKVFDHMTEVVNNPASQEEIKAVIGELEQYRERLINDIVKMGKKVKMSKKNVDKHISQHPEINKIDSILEQLHAQIGE